MERQKWNQLSIPFWKLLKSKITFNFNKIWVRSGEIIQKRKGQPKVVHSLNLNGLKIYNTHALLHISSACHEST